MTQFKLSPCALIDQVFFEPQIVANTIEKLRISLRQTLPI